MTPRVKICGITNIDDARTAVELGADAIGLNFYARSPRCISVNTALDIIRILPAFVDPVALFVNRSWDHMLTEATRVGVRTIQVHGDVLETCPAQTTCAWIPAFTVRDATSLDTIRTFLGRCERPPAAILVDAHVAGSYGGTGQVAPWELLRDFDASVPLILAGGLTPDNVAEAIRVVRPYAVDVASGVESAPGKKDHVKIRRFIEAVRGTSK